MNIQKSILCAAVALTTFGAGISVIMIGRYLLLESQVEERCVASLIPDSVPTSPQPLPVDDKSGWSSSAAETGLELSGYYFFLDKEPKDFKDVEYLSIHLADIDKENTGKSPNK